MGPDRVMEAVESYLENLAHWMERIRERALKNGLNFRDLLIRPYLKERLRADLRPFHIAWRGGIGSSFWRSTRNLRTGMIPPCSSTSS